MGKGIRGMMGIGMSRVIWGKVGVSLLGGGGMEKEWYVVGVKGVGKDGYWEYSGGRGGIEGYGKRVCGCGDGEEGVERRGCGGGFRYCDWGGKGEGI